MDIAPINEEQVAVNRPAMSLSKLVPIGPGLGFVEYMVKNGAGREVVGDRRHRELYAKSIIFLDHAPACESTISPLVGERCNGRRGRVSPDGGDFTYFVKLAALTLRRSL